MATAASPIRIGIYGPDVPPGPTPWRGCSLWPVGFAAAISHAGGEPVLLPEILAGRSLSEVMGELDGLVLTGSSEAPTRHRATEDRLCDWCQRHALPLLGVDHGLHVLNQFAGGTLYHDLSRDLHEALQHRHPPEEGLRHAINVLRGTRLAALYGEGEVVVNSEHRKAVQRPARGFRVSAVALDGVIEALEADDDWFALGVQWNPASATASGLDIQLFRGLIEACRVRSARSVSTRRATTRRRAMALAR
ncbi:MAG: gamma-glutamyl-gamma-aminobutyrate hydrolase family protein [Gemmataceae bacterium]|nr:gamma-glutamyl-gamma-aminobutyrate hydrolase family protein [Gemmataceae bacterium]MDW8266735.1 gamma-glutamyl-gamma-aminobutyrate hydrolase family protein [Gemmataceae bacterium]